MRRFQFALIAVTAIVIAAILAYVLYGGSGGAPGGSLVGGPFLLTDQDGKPRSDKNFRGKHMLIYFGYTYCPDVCPTALQVMARAIDSLPADEQKRVAPIFITIDPERDTAAHLKSYVENFHTDLVGLTGTAEQISEVARRYRVYFAKEKDSGSSTDYLMDHSSIVFLMAPDGGYITHFTHATPPEKMAETLHKRLGG